MKIIFVTDYFTGQNNSSCFDNIEKLYDDLSLFYDGHDKNCTVHTMGQWSGTPQTGMQSNCSCGIIDNECYQGYVKPMRVDDNAFGVWYTNTTGKFSRQPVKNQHSEFLIFNHSSYQRP